MAYRGSLNGMDALRREIDRAFEDFGLRTSPFRTHVPASGRTERRYPLVNVYEDKDALYAEALTPGVNPESLNVSVVRNTLTVSGEKRATVNGVKADAFHRSERGAGQFKRTVELPVGVDSSGVAANYNDGILRITLPKAAEARPRQIQVQVA